MKCFFVGSVQLAEIPPGRQSQISEEASVVGQQPVGQVSTNSQFGSSNCACSHAFYLVWTNTDYVQIGFCPAVRFGLDIGIHSDDFQQIRVQFISTSCTLTLQPVQGEILFQENCIRDH